MSITQCPDCEGTDLYDNTKTNIARAAEGKKLMPLYKCRACNWVKWPPKEEAPKKTVNTASATRSVFTVGKLAEKMNEAYETLQVAGFGLNLITIDVCFKMAFTELKGRNPGD